jgi:metal-responsive CopG/Arc/MetJ family transcriptional regulator
MSKTFNISLPEELVKQIDIYAKKNYMSRSELIKNSLIKEMKQESAVWSEVINFTELNENGVPASDILDAIKDK